MWVLSGEVEIGAFVTLHVRRHRLPLLFDPYDAVQAVRILVAIINCCCCTGESGDEPGPMLARHLQMSINSRNRTDLGRLIGSKLLELRCRNRQ